MARSSHCFLISAFLGGVFLKFLGEDTARKDLSSSGLPCRKPLSG